MRKQVTERSVEEAPDQQTNQFLDYIFTNVSRDMRKGLDWISSIKKKVNQALPKRRGASLSPKHNRHKLRPGRHVTPEAKTRGSQILGHPSIHPSSINQSINHMF